MMLNGIRPARISEAARLTQLCKEAAIPYGYDDEAIRRYEPALTVSLALIASGLAFVADNRNSDPIGVMALRPTGLGGLILLDRIFVHPSGQRQGVGRQLFATAVNSAMQLGGSAILAYAHPKAESFYARLGCIKIGKTPFYLSPELEMPMMVYSIPKTQ